MLIVNSSQNYDNIVRIPNYLYKISAYCLLFDVMHFCCKRSALRRSTQCTVYTKRVHSVASRSALRFCYSIFSSILFYQLLYKWE